MRPEPMDSSGDPEAVSAKIWPTFRSQGVSGSPAAAIAVDEGLAGDRDDLLAAAAGPLITSELVIVEVGYLLTRELGDRAKPVADQLHLAIRTSRRDLGRLESEELVQRLDRLQALGGGARLEPGINLECCRGPLPTLGVTGPPAVVRNQEGCSPSGRPPSDSRFARGSGITSQEG